MFGTRSELFFVRRFKTKFFSKYHESAISYGYELFFQVQIIHEDLFDVSSNNEFTPEDIPV